MVKEKKNKLKKDKKNKKENDVIDVKAETPKRKYRLIQSTQQNVPVKYISDNVVLTTDGRYVKILEIKAIPFLLKTTADKNKIYSIFRNIMRTGPYKFQIKCLSMQGDMQEQIRMLRKNRALEQNDTVLSFYNDYERRLNETQLYSVSRRFFIIFEYNEERRKKKKTSPEDIYHRLNVEANRIVNTLESCGNEVRSLDTDETLQVFYEIYNRDKARIVPFEYVYQNVVARYLRYYKGDLGKNTYIPFEEFIAPSKVDYRNSRYLILNDSTYYRFMFIPGSGYPSYVWPGWVDSIVSYGPGIDVDFFFEKERAKEVTEEKLKRNMAQAKAVINESREEDSALTTGGASLEASRYLLNGLRSGQDIFYVNTLITVTGSSPEEVDLYTEEIHKNLMNIDVNAIELETQYEEAFNSVLPLCKLDHNLFEKTKRNMLTEGAAAFYPFTTFELNHPEGINLGANMETNSQVVVDFFNTHLFSNANGFICGMPGAGKTYTLLLMAIRSRLSRIPVMIMAPEKEHEFMRLCEEIDGSFISISKGSKKILNPLEILKRDKRSAEIDDTLDGGEGLKASLMSTKIDSLITLFELIIGEKFTDYNEKVAVERLLSDTYKRFGITADNESLWADEEKTTFKKMPIFSDVKETMKNFGSLSPKIVNIIDQFTSGSLSNFNGQTNVDTDNEFIVFGLQHNDDDMMPAAMYIAMDFVWAKFQENRTRKKILYIDEWWKMAFNPIAADYSMKLARLVRGYGGGVWFATQQMTDIVASGERGLAVLGNCQTKILMRMSAQDIDAVSDMVNLTTTEEDKIERYKKGEALLIAGSTRMQIKFEASEREDLYCGTDRDTLKKFQMIKAEKKEKEEAEKERLNSLPDFDDIIDDGTDDASTKNEQDIIDIEIDDGYENLDDIEDDQPFDYTKHPYVKPSDDDDDYEDLDDDIDDIDEDIEDLDDEVDDYDDPEDDLDL